MDKEFTEAMRQSLTTMKQEILDKLVAANADFRAIVEEMDPKDFADVASDDVDRKMLEALGAQDVKRLLAEKPDVIGLAVPGMPFGSPGMGPESDREPYEVLLIARDGSASVFARYD